MNRKLLQAYQKERKEHIVTHLNGITRNYRQSASSAVRHAKTRIAWDNANGHVADEFDRDTDAEFGDVRLRILADCDIDLDNLFGDCFDPNVNDDIPAAKLEKQREEEVERVNRDGVWGIQSQVFGTRWETVDSCWGFIGEDWKESGYDIDAMNAALDERARLLAIRDMFD